MKASGVRDKADQGVAWMERLPHRSPFLFLTDVLSLEPGRTGCATWSLTGNESFFAGHFPSDPVVPGVLIIEALAQLSGLVCLHAESTGAAPGSGGRLVHADIRFDRGVAPPATIELRSSMSTSMASLRRCEVSATVNGVTVARGSLVLAGQRAEPQPPTIEQTSAGEKG